MAEVQALFEKRTLEALGTAAFERGIAEGGRYDSPVCAIDLALTASGNVGGCPSATTRSDPLTPEERSDPLTPREREVAALVAEGMSNRQIASALDLSPRTVDRHIEHILAKLGFRSRARIAAWWAGDHRFHTAPRPDGHSSL
jgi:DNA-binding CsgD family transcriptional regulator